jgi:hypothetical protein
MIAGIVENNVLLSSGSMSGREICPAKHFFAWATVMSFL